VSNLHDLRNRFKKGATPALPPGACCERDHDGDGNCDRHPAPRSAPPPPVEEPTPITPAGVYANLHAPGKAKAFKGWRVRVFRDGTHAWTMIVNWGAIDDKWQCSDRHNLSHEKRTSYTSDLAARNAAKKLIAAKKAEGYTVYTICKELT